MSGLSCRRGYRLHPWRSRGRCEAMCQVRSGSTRSDMFCECRSRHADRCRRVCADLAHRAGERERSADEKFLALMPPLSFRMPLVFSSNRSDGRMRVGFVAKCDCRVPEAAKLGKIHWRLVLDSEEFKKTALFFMDLFVISAFYSLRFEPFLRIPYRRAISL